MAEKTTQYYVPESSPWPLMGSIGLLLIAIGGANFIQQNTDKVQNDGHLGGVILAIGVLWIDEQCSFGVSVGVDESGGNDHACGINDTTCLSFGQIAYGFDIFCSYPYIGAIPSRP